MVSYVNIILKKKEIVINSECSSILNAHRNLCLITEIYAFENISVEVSYSCMPLIKNSMRAGYLAQYTCNFSLKC